MTTKLGDRLLVWVEVTQSCQLKCRYCYNPWRKEPAGSHSEMSDQTAESLLDFCNDLSAKFELEFAVAGGDPTAHPDYISLSSKLAALGPTAIVTHGCAFGDSDLEQIAETGTLRLQFSIPSLNAEQFKFVTGGGRLDSLLSNLAKASSLGIPLSMSAVVSQSKKAQEDAEALIRLANMAGAERLIFNKFLPTGRGSLYEEKFSLSDTSFKDLIRTATRNVDCSQVEVFVSEEHAGVRQLKIQQPKITITFDGQVRSCSMATAQIGTTRSEARLVMKRYEQFWSSEETDDGCLCSKTSAYIKNVPTADTHAA